VGLLTFDGFEIPGSHLLLYGKWDYQRQENASFGVEGVTVLTGERTKRDLVFESWLFDGYDQGSLDDFLESLADQQGNVGTLEESNDVLDRDWDNVEFVCFEMEKGPFPPGGTIAGSWWIVGKLHFIQLQPD
jgi:hypothetical protein